MRQRRRGQVAVPAVMALLLAVSGTAVAVTRARGGDGLAVRSLAPQSRPLPRSTPQPPSPPQLQSPPDPSSPPPLQRVPAAPEPGAPSALLGPAVIDVAVATLWLQPASTRSIDEPSLTNPVDVGQWVSSMTVADKLWLVGRLATQAVHGDRVTVVEVRGDWAKVVVADQPSSLDPRGYPGWLPAVQLSRGPVRPDTPGRAGSPTGEDLVAGAQAFTGVPYLWAGVSPFGFDCSGLTWAVYRAHGIVIPRDADDQAGAGTPVDASALEPGDLLFYASGPGRDTVHHVAMYVGNGTMIQSPATGRAVETVPVDTPEFAREFWGARRYRSA